MFSEPIHPAVVHFPMALVCLLPIFAAAGLWAIHRGAPHLRAWALPVALAAGLAASSFVAVRTGEADEERVEEVVPERVIHEHEEAAERFLILSAGLLIVAGAGLMRTRLGRIARVATLLGSIGLVAAGVQVGAKGGELVYRHGAANAYAEVPGAPTAERAPEPEG